MWCHRLEYKQQSHRRQVDYIIELLRRDPYRLSHCYDYCLRYDYSNGVLALTLGLIHQGISVVYHLVNRLRRL